MKNPILYVVLNKELNMSAGKAAAQTAHAVAMLGELNELFVEHVRRTVVVLQADNEGQIRNLSEYLDDLGVESRYYMDEGANEVSPYSVTALAVDFIDGDDERIREVFAPFELFSVPIDRKAVAINYLNCVASGYRTFVNDYTPRHLKKTIKLIEKED